MGLKFARNPLVSVIVPVYNREKYVAEALESIDNQTYRNIEIVVVDDGSQDNTPRILESFATDLELVVVTLEHSGVSEASNAGLRAARGELIARQDSDDISMPSRIERQVWHLSQSECDLVGSRADVMDETGALIGKQCYSRLPNFPLKHEEIADCLMTNNCIVHGSVMFRREILSDFDDEPYSTALRYAEDHDLWLRLVERGTIIHNLDEVLYLYRKHSGRITSEVLRSEGTDYWTKVVLDLHASSFPSDLPTDGRHP